MTAESKKLACSLYISRTLHAVSENSYANENSTSCLSQANLQNAVIHSQPVADWSIHETSCGLIITFSQESDAEKFIKRTNLSDIFKYPIQMTKFYMRHSSYPPSILLRGVPWTVPLKDLKSALIKQGISPVSVERNRQYVRIEVHEPAHYELLMREGLDFFGICRFSALPECTNTCLWQTTTSTINCGNDQIQLPREISSNTGEHHSQHTDKTILQCYRCQGFWHIAANCRHVLRCVRCGDSHTVEFCPRPRNNPICCHCLGPHHAGFQQCPVRLRLLNAAPISIILSADCADRVIVGQNSSSTHLRDNKSTSNFHN